LLVSQAETVLASATHGAHPVSRKSFETGSSGNLGIWISLRRIVDITAYITYVFLHGFLPSNDIPDLKDRLVITVDFSATGVQM
jgi:hypothetical protein